MKELIKQGNSKYYDFIELDPPYNIGKDKWDKFNSYEEYLNFIKEVMELSSKLMSDNGTLFLWHNDIKVLSDFIQLIKKHTDLKLTQQCIWNKYYKYNDDGTLYNQYGFLNGFIQSDQTRSYQKMCEYALYYTKQDDFIDHKLCLEAVSRIQQYIKDLIYKYKGNVTRANEFYCKWSGKTGNYRSLFFGKCQAVLYTEQQYKGLCEYIKSLGCKEELNPFEEILKAKEKYKESRFTYNADKNNFRSCIWQYPMSKETKHKTEKPLQLYYDMFEVHTRKNSKCLFPFVGSGNNIISLLELNKDDSGNREYIGYETDNKCFDLINKRIENNVEIKN
jgi:site-specific DNA-methyltransferase (adenine-specific)